MDRGPRIREARDVFTRFHLRLSRSGAHLWAWHLPEMHHQSINKANNVDVRFFNAQLETVTRVRYTSTIYELIYESVAYPRVGCIYPSQGRTHGSGAHTHVSGTNTRVRGHTYEPWAFTRVRGTHTGCGHLRVRVTLLSHQYATGAHIRTVSEKWPVSNFSELRSFVLWTFFTTKNDNF